MKLYLDNCSIQRPLDDKSQLRIAVESEIILNILSLIEAEKIVLVTSEILHYEANKINNIFRKEFTLRVLRKSSEYAELDDNIENRSNVFINAGIKPIDALHLASAEKMEADFFCTCDDKFLKKTLEINDLKIKTVSIFELLKEIEK